MFLNEIYEVIMQFITAMSNFVPLNKHQKKALVVGLYNEGKTRRQIAEVVHMSFKDIADIINEYTGEDIQVNKPEKSKDARAFELFLQGKQSVEVLLNQIAALENEKGSLNNEILGLKNSLYTNTEIIRKQNVQLRSLTRKQSILEIMLQNANKEPNYPKVTDLVNQRLNDKWSLLVAALLAVFKTLKTNPYGLNLLSSSPLDIEDYVSNDIDGKNLLRFAESCYNSLLKSYAKTIA
jgi:hypothetical protein